MNSSSKKMLIIASIVAGVLIAALLVYYFVFVNKCQDEMNQSNKNLSNTTTEASKDNATYKSDNTNKILAGELVDSSTNEQIASKIKGSVDLLENVSVNNVRVYRHNPTDSAKMVNQEPTNSGNAGANKETSSTNNEGGSSSVPSNSGNNVNVVLDLIINPESKDSGEINREMETTSNYLAETYAREMPNISVLVINYYVNNTDSIRAEFTYNRSGNNLFLQEFTL